MQWKLIVSLILNIPVSYLFFISFGWGMYFLCGGNPTYLIPFTPLTFIFYTANALLLIPILKLLKLFTINTYMGFLFETAIVYIFLWVLAR